MGDNARIDSVKFAAGGSTDVAAYSYQKEDPKPEKKTFLSNMAATYTQNFFNHPPIFESK